jgi:hypothetical protein
MAACLSLTLSPQIELRSTSACPAAEPQARQHSIADYLNRRVMPNYV